MGRTFIIAGAISGFLAVAAGAFAAHGLKARLDADRLAVFETAARYEMYHALALVAAGLLAARAGSWATSLAGWSFIAGTVIFSGSLYALALTGARALGAVTPIGGVAFLAGWGALAIAAMRLR
jgi:uncharacterized membrane protein YgdD (TMEM256/DUF423 family)